MSAADTASLLTPPLSAQAVAIRLDRNSPTPAANRKSEHALDSLMASGSGKPPWQQTAAGAVSGSHRLRTGHAPAAPVPLLTTRQANFSQPAPGSCLRASGHQTGLGRSAAASAGQLAGGHRCAAKDRHPAASAAPAPAGESSGSGGANDIRQQRGKRSMQSYQQGTLHLNMTSVQHRQPSPLVNSHSQLVQPAAAAAEVEACRTLVKWNMAL